MVAECVGANLRHMQVRTCRCLCFIDKETDKINSAGRAVKVIVHSEEPEHHFCGPSVK
jgi:hypothetical protein